MFSYFPPLLFFNEFEVSWQCSALSRKPPDAIITLSLKSASLIQCNRALARLNDLVLIKTLVAAFCVS